MSDNSPPFFLALIERMAALILLVIFLPMIVWIGFVLRINTDEPVLLTDEWLMRNGRKVRAHRFRTTGRGSELFRLIGRWVRSYSIDEFPALWDVLRGNIGFRHLLRGLLRHG